MSIKESVNYSVTNTEDEKNFSYDWSKFERADEAITSIFSDFSYYEKTDFTRLNFDRIGYIYVRANPNNPEEKRIGTYELIGIDYKQYDNEKNTELFEFEFKNIDNNLEYVSYYVNDDRLKFANEDNLYFREQSLNKITYGDEELKDFFKFFISQINPDSKYLYDNVDESVDYSVSNIDDNSEEKGFNYLRAEEVDNILYDLFSADAEKIEISDTGLMTIRQKTENILSVTVQFEPETYECGVVWGKKNKNIKIYLDKIVYYTYKDGLQRLRFFFIEENFKVFYMFVYYPEIDCVNMRFSLHEETFGHLEKGSGFNKTMDQVMFETIKAIFPNSNLYLNLNESVNYSISDFSEFYDILDYTRAEEVDDLFISIFSDNIKDIKTCESLMVRDSLSQNILGVKVKLEDYECGEIRSDWGIVPVYLESVYYYIYEDGLERIIFYFKSENHIYKYKYFPENDKINKIIHDTYETTAKFQVFHKHYFNAGMKRVMNMVIENLFSDSKYHVDESINYSVNLNEPLPDDLESKKEMLKMLSDDIEDFLAGYGTDVLKKLERNEQDRYGIRMFIDTTTSISDNYQYVDARLNQIDLIQDREDLRVRVDFRNQQDTLRYMFFYSVKGDYWYESVESRYSANHDNENIRRACDFDFVEESTARFLYELTFIINPESSFKDELHLNNQ